MSGNSLYDPDQNALDTRWTQPWSEAFRAQRDVGLRIPVNFITAPAVSLRQACFSDNQYEHNAFRKCFSNLLGVGFRRFAVDTYWDPLQSTWSLCPVEQPSLDSDGTDSGVSTSVGPIVVASTDTVAAKIPESSIEPLNSLGFDRRQDASQSSTSAGPSQVSTASTVSSPSSSAATRPTIVTFPSTNGPPLQQLGRYNCTALMKLDLLAGILWGFTQATSTTTGASLQFLTVNVHAASSIQNPNAPAPDMSTSQVPTAGNLLSEALSGNLTKVTYTPAQLQSQRSHLNSSWYNVEWVNRPAAGYYSVSSDAQSNNITQDGWPTEAFVEFKQFYRLSVSYGTVDSQMQAYDIAPDLNFMFPPGTFTNRQTPSFASNGQVLSGCLFDGSDKGVTSTRNSSWAIATTPSFDIGANPDLMAIIPTVANLTSCGISPFLNQSLGGTTADKNPLPYAAFVHSTLWSWAPGEPLNVTSASDDSRSRCAVMTPSGRWRVADCSSRYRAACRMPGQRYDWKISPDSSNYYDASSTCRAPYQFDVPHTALENAHLLAAFQGDEKKSPNEEIFIDLNSINIPECWVSGVNGTCPYLSSDQTDRIRIVVVPTVAAVIIFVLAALTFFVKCAANRRENKRGRRRKLVGGWEYEGVPS
ncbi:hypothetical protein DE146DRAFT_702427 [Phaeosphaeria sp. MPI-PUGE-AT-0046c]|nr:hypothetical protein DE146DRAFT_702427 [Phaeosphaeria sp. MPI-PUGE-AT-0046c]